MEPIYRTEEGYIRALADAFYCRSTQNKCPDTNRCPDCKGTDEQIRKCALVTAKYFYNGARELMEQERPHRFIDRITKKDFLEILEDTKICDFEKMAKGLFKEENERFYDSTVFIREDENE